MVHAQFAYSYSMSMTFAAMKAYTRLKTELSLKPTHDSLSKYRILMLLLGRKCASMMKLDTTVKRCSFLHHWLLKSMFKFSFFFLRRLFCVIIWGLQYPVEIWKLKLQLMFWTSENKNLGCKIFKDGQVFGALHKNCASDIS